MPDNKTNKKNEVKKIEAKKSKYEKVLSLSSNELIAKAIQDVLKREDENANFRKNRKK